MQGTMPGARKRGRPVCGNMLTGEMLTGHMLTGQLLTGQMFTPLSKNADICLLTFAYAYKQTQSTDVFTHIESNAKLHESLCLNYKCVRSCYGFSADVL